MITDPIADMLTRLRNASLAGHESMVVPASRMKIAIAKILREEGFIRDYEVVREKARPQRSLRIWLSYTGKKEPVLTGLRRVSKPGQRVYARRTALPRVLGGIGLAIVSTPKGVMAVHQARRLNTGGEVLCYVW